METMLRYRIGGKTVNMELKIYKEENNNNAPMDLLLIADPAIEAINEYLFRGELFICKMDKIVGAYIILNTRPKTYELMNIVVDETYQGKGIAKKMISDAISRVKKMGGKTFEVGTGNSSIDQLAFYQKSGFRITGIDKDYFIDNYDEKIYENGIQCIDMIRLSMKIEG